MPTRSNQRSARFALPALALLLACVPPASARAMLDDPPTMGEVQSAMQSGDYAGAESKARAITIAQPNNANAWFMLGYALHAQGELDDAIAAHKKAASFPQTAGPATYNLACALALKGDADGSFEALNKAARLGVRNADQYKNDTDLSTLHDDARWEPFVRSVADMQANPPERWLSFWAGSWDCYSRNGSLSGTNTLTPRLAGAVLHEQWTPTTGAPGESWNYYDPADNRWHQVWVETGGAVTRFAGVRKDTGVSFEGERVSNDGSTTRATMFVRPIGDQGWVRQTGGLVQPDGSIAGRYDLVYVPTGQPFDPSQVAW